MATLFQPYFHQYRLNALLITNLVNVRYLTNFTGTNGYVLLTKKRSFFITDFRYLEQATQQVKGFTIIKLEQSLGAVLEKRLKNYQPKADPPRADKIKRLGFEASNLNYAQYLRLKKSLKKIKLIPIIEDTATIRQIKTSVEIKRIERALMINKLAFDEVGPKIKPGMKETEIKRYLEIAMLKHGAEKIAFDTIVASGWRGALPHGVASNKKIKAGELVTIDFGCVVDGYNSDETVTVEIGEANLTSILSSVEERQSQSPPLLHKGEGRVRSRQLKIHQIVLAAQQAAIAAARPGARCSDIDKAARDYITEKGYGEYFGHALGHGVGLEVHERPVLSPNSTDVLEEGMVFTIEPGIYIPGFGGVRVEDVFVCTRGGVRRLSRINKKLGD